MALRRKRLRFVHATPRARSHGGWWPDTLASKGEPARDGDGSEAVGGRAVAERAVRIAAPPVGGPASGHPAHGVVARGAHRGEGEPARDRDWGGAVRGRAVAELAAKIRAPTVGGPGGRHTA